MGLSLVNQPFWESPTYGNPQIEMGISLDQKCAKVHVSRIKNLDLTSKSQELTCSDRKVGITSNNRKVIDFEISLNYEETWGHWSTTMSLLAAKKRISSKTV